MRNGIPVVYWTFRVLWTVVHFVIVVMAVVGLTTWAVTDNNAVRIFEPVRDNVLMLQQRVSNLIPWPWGGGDANSQSERSSQRESAKTFRIRADVNVRAAPRAKAKVVKVLKAGSSVKVDCRTQGTLVSSKKYGDSTGWIYIRGLGYFSEVFASTGTHRLPVC